MLRRLPKLPQPNRTDIYTDDFAGKLESILMKADKMEARPLVDVLKRIRDNFLYTDSDEDED